MSSVCQKQDDTCDMKIFNACELSYGKPCGPCTEYFELEAQIEETRKTLEQQLEQRLKIRKKINRIHDPMLIRVPPEITAYIFELAASVDIPPDGSKSLREGELYSPLPLGKVCGAWRDIAWGMPQLWNFFFVKIRCVEDLPLRLDVARQWLARSGAYLPLSIHFIIHDIDKNGNWNWLKFIPFIGLINLYSRRWKDLCGVARSYLLEEFCAESHGAPMLQNLQLMSLDTRDAMKFDLGCARLPQPRSLHFNNVYAPDFHIDWGHVTQLETNSLLIDQFLDQLPQLHELKKLKISGMDISVDHQARSVTHMKLESLDIRCMNQNLRAHTQILCNSLVLPSLQHLKFNLLEDRTMPDAIVSLIQRSSCTLSSLSLYGCPSDSRDALIRLLECADSIKELEIANFFPHDGGFLTALQSHIEHRDDLESQTLPLPNLQSLSYLPKGPRGIPWDTLFLIFERNSAANLPPGKSLSIRPVPSWSRKLVSQEIVHKDLPDEVLRRLLQLVEAGVEFFLPRKMSQDDFLDVMKAKEDDLAQRAAEMAELEAGMA